MVDQAEREAIWDQLKAIAMKDGKLTPDEEELMISIISDIEKYSHLLQKAKADGKIDSKEEKELFEGRMEIIEKAYAKARTDKIVSSEERALLKEMVKIIRAM
ncbi:MAG: hypothetical protein ACXAE3_08085 [Candidatus Kariarchaeaceae archaeon]|jgi:tellurite resistance protein